MIYRIDVRTAALASESAARGQATVDPVGEAIRHQIAEFGTTVGPISTSRIFLIDTDAGREHVERAARELLADPVVEQAEVVDAAGGAPADGAARSRIEIHLKPGVMDPVAASTEMALRAMKLSVNEVRTGRAYVIEGNVDREELQRIASRVLANGVIESVHFDRFIPEQFQRGHEYQLSLRHVPMRELSDEQLTKLSREGHLFLSLAEMQAVQAYFRAQGREPTDVELETIAQTWSEHCVHKTLKSAVDVSVRSSEGAALGTRHYDNLIKETIFASTVQLMDEARRQGGTEARTEAPADPSSPSCLSASVPSCLPSPDFCLSVFKDNAGVVAFDDVDAVCFKVETHNHPSAIEPYGGSATGAGGVIRDILGTGLGARPVANTDVFCVAFPDAANPSVANPRSQIATLPKGVIHPKRVLQQVVAGVRDYGNRMGIPTVNGAVYFDDRYLGNPLVFCGCVGIIPRDKISKEARDGDAIVVMGGRTGRDGIHGATFSSAELTDTHADEFSHAVQIGNAITEKKVADVLLQARDRGLFTAVTDCGAGGLSSAVGEMGEKIGAAVELDQVPLKYAGLRYDEIWISEAQERMVLSVPREKLDELLALSRAEDVESSVIGTFGTPDRALRLSYRGTEVGRISMDFLHHGIPMPLRKAVVIEGVKQGVMSPAMSTTQVRERTAQAIDDTKDRLLALLAHPNIASKHWIIRQYDHEVQGGSVIKPLTGPRQVGPSDAAVLRPKLGSRRGIAIGCGMAPHIADPYQMAIASIDEAVRNVIAVGAPMDRIAILDNFCWPSVDDELTMGTLVRACEACRDAALAYGIPFISGKDSLHNQFTDSETGAVLRIPSTLLISAIAVIEDVQRCVTMDLKRPDNNVFLLGPAPATDPTVPKLHRLPPLHRALAEAIRRGLIASCHDVSDGGALTAAAEMCIASGLGLSVPIVGAPDAEDLFRETVGRYLVEVPEAKFAEALTFFQSQPVTFKAFGRVLKEGRLVLSDATRVVHDIIVESLAHTWRGTLDW